MTPLDTASVPTTPIPPAVDAARRLLAGALDHPGADTRDPNLIAISEALVQLTDVMPPYPPLPAALPHVAAEEACEEALAELAAALDQARSVQELSRIGLASMSLRYAGRTLA